MNLRIAAIVLTSLLTASVARADRVQVYSVQGLDCAECWNAIKTELKKVKGVKRSEFDRRTVELRLSLDDRVTDDAVLEAIARSDKGFHGAVGPGKGSYIPFEKYPEGSDVAVLTSNGSAVGSLEMFRVAGKYTVLDIYADWCGPCRVVDSQLRALMEQRTDIAVRKLNLVDFKSPLAKEMGAKLKGLPYLIIFSPDGKRTDLLGANPTKMAAALKS